MKKQMDRVDFSRMSKLELVPGSDTINDSGTFYHVQQEFAEVININSITTPLLILPLDNGFNRVMKRGIDIMLSLAFILLIFPWLFPVIAILIKINSRGPVFFLQKRNKRNSELFTCIKFRTMVKNAHADTLPACKYDKRITGIGRFLRNNHLDELPQFFNVLWGDMSVVGPRPHMVSDNLRFDELIKNYTFRHRVKPGITGLAQVLGFLGPVEEPKQMEDRVNMDIFYTRHWSLKLDLVIIFRTIVKTVGG